MISPPAATRPDSAGTPRSRAARKRLSADAGAPRLCESALRSSPPRMRQSSRSKAFARPRRRSPGAAHPGLSKPPENAFLSGGEYATAIRARNAAMEGGRSEGHAEEELVVQDRARREGAGRRSARGSRDDADGRSHDVPAGDGLPRRTSYHHKHGGTCLRGVHARKVRARRPSRRRRREKGAPK